MMPAILWKEYREHRMVWVVLAFISAASLLSLSRMASVGWFGARPDGLESRLVAIALAGVYGLICGAMMLAGERENRTMPYLDALPGFRRRLWQGKFLAGVLLVTGQIILLMCLCAAVFLFENWREAAWTVWGMLLAGLFGLSWGMLFSAVERSVTTAILLSLAGLVPLCIVFGVLVGLVTLLAFEISGNLPEQVPGHVVLYYLLFVTALVALVGSAVAFTGLDRRRLRAVPKSLPIQRPVRHPSWSMLFWLTWRQARGFAVGLAAFALLLGFILLLEPVFLWPAATLVVGVLCGATAFADEQQGPFRFLGDQRLPLGRLWVAKVGVRFGIAVVAALLVLAPSVIAALANIPTLRGHNGGPPYHFLAHVFHSDILVNLCPPGLFFTLWLVYGFAAGCLFGLLFRHGLAAGVFALFTSSMAAALWIPSLLGGGLHAWQVLVPPLLLLASTTLLMRPWAAGRIASLTTALRLTPFVVLAALWIAGGLWYRVLEIPNVPSKFDLDAFRASLPPPEQDESGRLFHSACLRFDDLRRTLESTPMPLVSAPAAMGAALPPGVPGAMGPAAAGGAPGMAAPGGMPPQGAPPEPPLTRMERRQRNADVLEHGWPAKDRDLPVWLDKLYAGEWATMLKQAADLPTSPFDDVRNATFLEPIPATQYAHDVAVVLAVRGLQRQAAGDDEAYVENLRIGLSLSRSMRDHTFAADLRLGRAVEGTLLKGLDRWLEKLHGKPDLIRQALALLSRHLDETVEDGKDLEAIMALCGKNSLDDPVRLLEQYQNFEDGAWRQKGPTIKDEAVGIAIAWLVPWEQARQDRIFRAMFYGDKEQQSWLVGLGNGLGPQVQFGPNDLVENFDKLRKLAKQPGELCDARVMQLKLALRWFQADNGKPAENLDELVPKYLPSVPIDPYDGEPFRYRLSRGEEIVLPVTRKIPPGQGVLSSVGEDRIFLVPLPPKAK
jgi:ABC-type transport system involved in multi-copper enzyme maturation permease subunit